MIDPQEYLQPGYDVSKAKIPDIRSILLEHDIDYPSNATKNHLVDIFNEKIKPNAAELLKKYENIKPSSNGIIDMTPNSSKSNQNITIEPSPVSDSDKIIPSKRHSDSEDINTSTSKPQKKPKRKVRKRIVSNNISDSDSFLSMEKFEINENDNIFKGSIDNKPLNVQKTKYASISTSDLKTKPKTPVKDILSKFDKSVPPTSSKKIKSEKVSTKSKSASTTPKKNLDTNKDSDNIANKTVDADFVKNSYHPQPSSLADDLFNLQNDTPLDFDFDHNQIEAELLNNQINNTFDYKNDNNVSMSLDDLLTSMDNNENELQGPTKNIKETIINIASSDDEEVVELDIIEEKTSDGNLVSTMDAKSFSSFGTDEISFSQDSIKFEESKKEEEEEEEKSEEKPDTEETDKLDTIVDEKVDIKDAKESVDEPVVKQTEIGSTSGLMKFILTLLFTFFLTINIAIPTLGFYFMREIKLNTGYCGFDQPSKLLDIWDKVPESLQENLLPIKPYINEFESLLVDAVSFDCEECPEHGSCTLNTLKCDYGYTKTYPLESLFGLIPLNEKCEYDYLREEKMRYLSKYTLSYLHRHNEEQLTLDELYNYLRSTKPSSMSVEEYEEYWKNFVENELSNEPEVQINFNTQEITLSHRTPTEHYTKTFGNVERRAKTGKKLFQKTPPTVDVKDYYTKSSA